LLLFFRKEDLPCFGAIRVTQSLQAETGVRQFITFTLGAQEYGVDIMLVREIKGWTETTSLPQAPPHVRGVINLRGIIVPIFDLRARFGMGPTLPTRMHVVIIVIAGGRTTGLLVDAVSDILSVSPDQVRPVPEFGTEAEAQFLEGLVSLDERMVTLVRLDGLIRVGEVRAELPQVA
jgi:purine-binding chemotaxis protein CheW